MVVDVMVAADFVVAADFMPSHVAAAEAVAAEAVAAEAAVAAVAVAAAAFLSAAVVAVVSEAAVYRGASAVFADPRCALLGHRQARRRLATGRQRNGNRGRSQARLSHLEIELAPDGMKPIAVGMLR